MNKVLVITGDLATGKSTYANILSRKLNILLLTKDKIKELLGDNIGFSNREENLKLSRASLALMFYVLKETIKVDLPIILEANFKKDDITTLYNLTASNSKVLVLNFTGKDEILYQRFMNRINNEGRHIVHQSAGLTNVNKFKEYLAKGREVDLSQFKVVNIDASDFNYQKDEILFKNIRNFLYE